MKYPFQDLRDTNTPYSAELKSAADRVITSGRYLQGIETELFEKELATLIGVKRSIGCGNGLDALRLIFRAYIELGHLKPGDEVIVPANTFIATVLPLTDLGLKPKLMNPDASTYCLDLRNVLANVTPKTRAVAIVHLYGTPTWDESAAEELRSRGILIIEDNAQAIGASWHGRATGSLGDASAISFYPAKNIGALGDAGAVCSNDEQLIETISALHNYGSHERYIYQYCGYNSRIDELQAAFLRIKLRHLESTTQQRNAAAAAYNREINHREIIKPTIVEDTIQAWHQYVIRCSRRDELQSYLAGQGVGTMVHYPVAIHKQPCYSQTFNNEYSLSEELSHEILSLPIANISASQACEIAQIINKFPHS